MKRRAVALLCTVLTAAVAVAQDATTRPWQQRLHTEIPLPVPMVSLSSTNPFSSPVDTIPELLGSTAPRRIDVSGPATAAAYVDTKGECLGAVPIELPFPGLTSTLVEELRAARFEPGRTGNTPQPSWTVIEVKVDGKVKESSVADQTLELPDPSSPPVQKTPTRVAPPGNLLTLPATPVEELTSRAVPRRLKLKAPGRDTDVPIQALVHVTSDGRADRFVPLNVDAGFHRWLSAYLASWRLQPAVYDGQPVDSWVVYNARVNMKLSALSSSDFRASKVQAYDPDQAPEE
jgi:hypothetical protein